jgi:subtilisin
LRWRGAAGGPIPSPAPATGVTVLDTLAAGASGATLVALPSGGQSVLRRELPGVLVAPIRRYRPALFRPDVRLPMTTAAFDQPPVEVRVVSAADGRPLPGVHMVAFVDFASRVGADARSDRNGVARLRLGDATVLERLYSFDALDHWSQLRRRVTVGPEMVVALRPLDLATPDQLAFRYGTPRSSVGRGVRVAVVDTGVALEHPDLVVTGGRNCVLGEDEADFGPNGLRHGTHVAGIVAARGRPPSGRAGVAPGVELRSYRVFGRGDGDATNFAIAKAVDAAVEDGCDVINLSLGGGRPDPVIRAALEEAQLAGAVVVAAAGNDGRQPVSFPAHQPDVLAVSALGRTGTFPPDAAGSAERRGPYGDDGADFVAAFSNVGHVTVTAPGVAIVSTVPGGYVDLDGTSMACPAVTGVVARVLSGTRAVRNRPRGPERAAAVVAELRRRARSLGFPPALEGHGLAK